MVEKLCAIFSRGCHILSSYCCRKLFQGIATINIFLNASTPGVVLNKVFIALVVWASGGSGGQHTPLCSRKGVMVCLATTHSHPLPGNPHFSFASPSNDDNSPGLFQPRLYSRTPSIFSFNKFIPNFSLIFFPTFD